MKASTFLLLKRGDIKKNSDSDFSHGKELTDFFLEFFGVVFKVKNAVRSGPVRLALRVPGRLKRSVVCRRLG